jgi:hypothetical protein
MSTLCQVLVDVTNVLRGVAIAGYFFCQDWRKIFIRATGYKTFSKIEMIGNVTKYSRS